MLTSSRRGFTLMELLVVVGLLALLVAILLPTLSRARKSAVAAKLANQQQYAYGPEMAQMNARVADAAGAPVIRPLAQVRDFKADIALTPKLSVGTAEPESIYEAKFHAAIEAVSPGGQTGPCEIQLPLPPEIISLADLKVTANTEPSEMVAMREGKLVWRGTLTSSPTPLEVTYTAVGKGLYALEIPPGGILENFQIDLKTVGSDVRMLELSLQPTKLNRTGDATHYTWNYSRLIFGQPIRLDVLGIAPIDQLGELSWLGPISVVVFGLLVGLVVRGYQVSRFDRWMLLLTVGTFTAAYPLMYFAQEFISLRAAIVGSAALVLAIIAFRTITIMGPRLALLGIVVPATAILAVTLGAAVQHKLVGILLTAEALGFFVLAMVLAPRLKFLDPPPAPAQPTAAAA